MNAYDLTLSIVNRPGSAMAANIPPELRTTAARDIASSLCGFVSDDATVMGQILAAMAVSWVRGYIAGKQAKQ